MDCRPLPRSGNFDGALSLSCIAAKERFEADLDMLAAASESANAVSLRENHCEAEPMLGEAGSEATLPLSGVDGALEFGVAGFLLAGDEGEPHSLLFNA